MNSKIAIIGIGNDHESALAMALLNSFEQNVVVVDNVKEESLLKKIVI
jgi:hypothetical protein